jgi:hypothetical protein
LLPSSPLLAPRPACGLFCLQWTFQNIGPCLLGSYQVLDECVLNEYIKMIRGSTSIRVKYV